MGRLPMLVARRVAARERGGGVKGWIIIVVVVVVVVVNGKGNIDGDGNGGKVKVGHSGPAWQRSCSCRGKRVVEIFKGADNIENNNINHLPGGAVGYPAQPRFICLSMSLSPESAIALFILLWKIY